MACSATAIDQYEFQPGEKLFLDTNIWLLIYGVQEPQEPEDKRIGIYSEALKQILSNKCQVYIDVLVVSEFINVYAKKMWAISKKDNAAFKNKSFKVFRNSADFEPIAGEIADNVRRILKDCTCVESGFESTSVNDIIEEYAKGKSDFDDQVFTSLCQKHNFKIVTDDSDFKDCNVHVITANEQLLS